MKHAIIKNSPVNVKTTDKNITSHYSNWLATELYNQFVNNNAPMKLLNYVDKKKRNIIMLQSEIIKNLRNGISLNSSYRPVRVDDLVDFNFKVGTEHQKIDVREARLGLTESNAFVSNLRYYFDLYGGNMIQVQLASYLIFSYLKPKYSYDNKDILLRNLREKEYSGDFSFDAVEDGLSLDLVSYYVVKSDVVKSIDEIRLDEWSELSREIGKIINEIMATNRYKVLFNNLIASSVMKLVALPNLDSPDIFNQHSMFLNFSVVGGSGFVSSDGLYRSVLSKRDNTI